MALNFYPHHDELGIGTIEQRLEVLLGCAERYKSIVLDATSKLSQSAPEADSAKKRLAPRDIQHAFNWDEIARLLRDIRELPEGSPANKLAKADRLTKLAEIYEVLRGAKMAKLEAVRLALINEAKQLRA